MMTVKELIEGLSKLPQDMEVWIAKDEEGNGFEKLLVMPEVHWFETDELEPHAIHPGDVGTEYEEENLTQVVIVWP